MGRWPQRRWKEIEEQVHRVGTMIGSPDVTIERVAESIDLTAAERNRFLAPLSGMPVAQ
ncbi:MAG: hypothetical protein GY720_02485 [bacterium]|nr:hypothetical protein [bacterium]